jgi:CubicO group peptidase (beta-lactamase class C family)
MNKKIILSNVKREKMIMQRRNLELNPEKKSKENSVMETCFIGRTKKRLVLFLTASFLSLAGLAQQFDKAKLDAYFDTLASKNRFMGSVAVAQGGKLIYSKSVGFTDVEQGLKATENSKYRIGSITKTFTTVLTLMAVEENKLSLNQTIDKWFPSIGNADKITIEHMLYHRSGLHNHVDKLVNSNQHIYSITENEMIEIIIKNGNDFKPDMRTSYCNPGFILLTYILEKIYEKPFSKILEEKITTPIGLKNTYMGEKINTSNNESNSYTFLNKSWTLAPEFAVSQVIGAGAITSTPIDLVIFSHALFSGKLISENSLEKMKTIKDNFGMGLIQAPFDGKIGFGHSGGIDGFRSLFLYFPDSNISFAYTTNGINYKGNDIAIAVLSAAYNKPFDIPEFKTYELTDKDLDKYLGIYSSEQLPLKMTITKNNGELFAQATGQSAFPLEATEKNKFQYLEAGVILEFNPGKKTMVLKQGGVYNFVKDGEKYGKIKQKKEPTAKISSKKIANDNYVGVYSSEQSPLKITITRVNGELFAQATGQAAFLLDSIGKDKFEYGKAGIVMEFNPDKRTMLMKEGRVIYNFVKDGKKGSKIKQKEEPTAEVSSQNIADDDLDKYVGVYSSGQIPLKITVTKINGELFAQGTGQAAFPLDFVEEDTFEFDEAGIVIEFNPDKKTMVLKQGREVYNFVKESPPVKSDSKKK